ncbi:hypothetical protein GCM10010508_47230 [Streptomyces naganishii JCM 4654]|uniref:Uncharacterized protein n=1 Tax=Streptomyces naganishii JCM 4654 TaxID=1306179 RepID=A0A919CWW1_9ACTN|nr:hypothetical protein GCM10010508_47230 [Streptomyces naganishii JCM 4654]
MLLQDRHPDSGPREQQPQHHPRRPGTDYAARRTLRHAPLLPLVRLPLPDSTEHHIATVRTVLEVLERHVSEGEWDHLKSGLPNSLASVLP